jgi:PQQ-like domain
MVEPTHFAGDPHADSSKIDPGLGRSLGLVPIYAQAGQSLSGVYTYHYDNQRTGENTSETLLTPANVNASTFGKLFSDSVDGQIYTQPLYVAGVTVGGGTHNVVYVATENDTVYAFDADTGGAPLWQTSLLPAGATPIPIPFGCDAIVPMVGITPTPVIDPATGTIYVLAQSQENGTDVHRLHGLRHHQRYRASQQPCGRHGIFSCH